MRTRPTSKSSRKLSFGGWLKETGQTIGLNIRDAGVGTADMALGLTGATDVIGDGAYKTKSGRTWNKISDVAAPIAGMVGATALGVPPQVTMAVQQAGRGVNQSVVDNRANAEEQSLLEQQQREQYQRSISTTSATGGGGRASYGDGGNLTGSRRSRAARMAQFAAGQQQQVQATLARNRSLLGIPLNDHGLPLGSTQLPTPPPQRNAYGELLTAVPGLPQRRFARGGRVPGSYEVEADEVVQGAPQLEDGYQIASDLHVVGGDKHEDGGTAGVGGERVFSDRLTLPGSKKTFADEATRIGKQKGKLEKKNGGDRWQQATYDRSAAHFDKTLDDLFTIQESLKTPQLGVGSEASFAGGGPLNYAGWDPTGAADPYAMMRPVQTPWSFQPSNNPGTLGWDPTGAQNGQGMDPTGMFNFTSGRKDYAGWDPTGARGTAASPRAPVSGPTYDPLAGMNTISPGEPAGGGMGVAGYAEMVAPYIDNIAAAFAKVPGVPAPQYMSAPQLDTHVNVNADLARVRQGTRDVQRGFDGVSDPTTSRANRIAAYVGGLGQEGQILQGQRNQERELTNRNTELKVATENQNSQILNNYKQQVLDNKNRRQKRRLDNVNNAAMDFQQQLHDRKLREADVEKMRILAPQFARSGVLDRAGIKDWLVKSGMSEKEADELAKGYKAK